MLGNVPAWFGRGAGGKGPAIRQAPRHRPTGVAAVMVEHAGQRAAGGSQRNAGRGTPGVDGQVALSSKARAEMAVQVHHTISTWIRCRSGACMCRSNAREMSGFGLCPGLLAGGHVE